MVKDAAHTFKTAAIPEPHVTALYGIDLEEGEVRRIFREDVLRVMEETAKERRRNGDDDGSGSGKTRLWPDLNALGILVDVEYDGVDNGTMVRLCVCFCKGGMFCVQEALSHGYFLFYKTFQQDMAWAEVTFATSPEHEALIDALYHLFYRPNDNNNRNKPRTLPWAPHLSLCYDNPDGFPHNLSRKSITNFINEQAPTLGGAIDDAGETVNFSRQVCGISLWSTKGTMSQWRCLDRIDFQD